MSVNNSKGRLVSAIRSIGYMNNSNLAEKSQGIVEARAAQSEQSTRHSAYPAGNPPQPMNTVSVEDLDFSTFLFASRRLRFIGASRNGGPYVNLTFEGTPEELASLEREYLSGASLPVLDVLSAFRQVRRVMDRATGNNSPHRRVHQ